MLYNSTTKIFLSSSKSSFCLTTEVGDIEMREEKIQVIQKGSDKSDAVRPVVGSKFNPNLEF